MWRKLVPHKDRDRMVSKYKEENSEDWQQQQIMQLYSIYNQIFLTLKSEIAQAHQTPSKALWFTYPCMLMDFT